MTVFSLPLEAMLGAIRHPPTPSGRVQVRETVLVVAASRTGDGRAATKARVAEPSLTLIGQAS